MEDATSRAVLSRWLLRDGTIAYGAAQRLQVEGARAALLALFDTMNWSRIPITLSSNGAYTFERLLFQSRDKAIDEAI
jgi:thioesterase domain-containing protein